MRNHQHRGQSEDPGRQHGRGRGRDEAFSGRTGEDSHHPRERHGPGGREGRGGPGGRGRRRAQRGDVRTAILMLLAEEPMHGYQLMQAMSDRTQGAWRPSPGAVYPTLDQLEDEGLATIHAEGGRRLVTLTPDGQAHLAEHAAELGDPFTDFTAGTAGPDLREPLSQLHMAARQIAASGSAAQVEAASTVLAQARRSLYLILAGDPEDHEG